MTFEKEIAAAVRMLPVEARYGGSHTLLGVGFMIHNVTEGIAIAAPISKGRFTLATVAALGILAGGPTIAGTWLEGFAYSAFGPRSFSESTREPFFRSSSKFFARFRREMPRSFSA
jgi:zinc transporter ZupT